MSVFCSFVERTWLVIGILRKNFLQVINFFPLIVASDTNKCRATRLFVRINRGVSIPGLGEQPFTVIFLPEKLIILLNLCRVTYLFMGFNSKWIKDHEKERTCDEIWRPISQVRSFEPTTTLTTTTNLTFLKIH